MQLFPPDITQTIEFDKILAEVNKHCDSKLGTDRVQKVRPLDKYEEIKKILQQTKEMTLLLQFEDNFPHDKIYDLTETIQHLGIENYVLTEMQFHEIKKTALLTGSIIRFFTQNNEKYPALNSVILNIEYIAVIPTEIKKIINDEGDIRFDASPELIRIKKEKDNNIRSLDKVFNSALAKYRKAGYLSDVEESMRNGRRVIGIQSEYKRKMSGIIHDESDTGKTIFIEPEEVVNIQNEIFELEREEKREIYRILKELTAVISPYRFHLERYLHLLSIIDFTRAKAKYALEINAQMPILDKQPVIYLFHATHPVLFQLNKKLKKPVVPLDIELDMNKRILIISGPNAGGKSVAMKTIGLLQFMTQCGLLIPAAENSRIGIFNNIFCDIGDTQSLEDELSTYSSRLMKINYFLQHSDKQTLILIDEFGTGTDPVMGGAIAEATLKILNDKKVFGVVTTHYANLKAFAANNIGVMNGSMLYDEKELKPLYKLEAGKPGSSYAFELAKKSHLPDTLIEEAKKLIGIEHIRFEELLKNVRIEKEHIRLRDKEVNKKEEDLKKKEQLLQTEFEKAKEKQERYNLKKLEKEDDSIRKMEIEFKTLLNELRNTKKDPESDEASIEKTKEKLRQFISSKKKKTFGDRKIMHNRDTSTYQKGEIKIGGLVKLVSGSEIGTLESINKNRATVIFRNIKTTVPLDELIGIASTDAPPVQKETIKLEIENDDFPLEIDLRGKSKEEAMVELENYLDKAMMRNVFQVRILHGKGTGAIREISQKIIKKHPGVQKFEFASRESGGDGVTIVDF
ncbi:MAG: endonuclease MutS2 [Chitinophagales bacterium]